MTGAPLRIRRPDPGGLGMRDGASSLRLSWQSVGRCWTRFLKLIPSEVIMLYLVVRGFLPEGGVVSLWILTCVSMALLIIIRAFATSDKAAGEPVQWAAVILAAISFVVWLYASGGLFAHYEIHWPVLASALMLVWTLVLAFGYEGD